MIDVRRIRIREAHSVRELVREATAELAARYPEDDIGISGSGLDNLETAFRLGAVHEDEVTLVAVDGQEIVGFASAWITRGRATPGTAGEIGWCWARPGEGRERVERELAQATVTWLQERGVGAIFRIEDAHDPRREPWESVGFEADVVRYSRYVGRTNPGPTGGSG
jgi:hypothetical protein